MNSSNYPFDKLLPSPIIGKSLEQQYNFITDILMKYKPDLCLKILTEDLEEFHHILWDNTYLNSSIFKVKNKKGFLKSEEIYCSIIDSKFYSLELFNIIKYTLTKTAFKGSWKLNKCVVSIRSDEFDLLFEEMMKSEPISYEDLPEGIKRNI